MTKRDIKLCCLLLSLSLSACGGGGGSSSKNNQSQTSSSVIPGSNVASLYVDRGPSGLTPGQYTVNEVFTSVTICDSETADNCQTIDHILVDTGSSGLRIISSVISPSLNLPTSTDGGGNKIGECGMFVDGYTWGPVKTATIQIANQTALSVPIQVIGEAGFSPVPSACSSTGNPENDVASFGANGVLGIGYFDQDCGSYCTFGTSNVYYSCNGGTCTSTTMPLSQQLANPVSRFASDNNGIMLSLPSLSNNGAQTVTGSLVFGINTQDNNQLGNAQIYTVAPGTGYITTVLNGQSLSNSFIDSGSNGLYFNENSLAVCSASSSFYCPPSTQSFTATIRGRNNTAANIPFNVANANTLFSTGNTAFADLAGNISINSFDWGLPFFFGRQVFVAFENQPVGGAQGPFIAF